jgi:hypothetical protein
LPSAFQNGTESKTRWALLRKCPPGSSGGTSRVMTSLVCEPIRNDQYNGSAEPTMNAVSSP